MLITHHIDFIFFIHIRLINTLDQPFSPASLPHYFELQLCGSTPLIILLEHLPWYMSFLLFSHVVRLLVDDISSVPSQILFSVMDNVYFSLMKFLILWGLPTCNPYAIVAWL